MSDFSSALTSALPTAPSLTSIRGHGSDAPVSDFPIIQADSSCRCSARIHFCRRLFISHIPSELPPETYALPWDPSPAADRWRICALARRAGSLAADYVCENPGFRTPESTARLRSFLGRAAGCGEDVARRRFVTPASPYWNAGIHAHPDAPLETHEVVITVPASFDEIARALTVTAARRAGFEKFTLVEEPQAAFYDFTARHRHDLGAALKGVSTGSRGGCRWRHVRLHSGRSRRRQTLRRIAVGDHLDAGRRQHGCCNRAQSRRTDDRRRAQAQSDAMERTRAGEPRRKESLLSANAPETYPPFRRRPKAAA